MYKYVGKYDDKQKREREKGRERMSEYSAKVKQIYKEKKYQ